MELTPHVLERMRQRNITEPDLIAALTHPSEIIGTRANRIALFSTVNNRYLLVILEKVNNEDVIITAMWSDSRRLRRIGFTKV